MNQITNCDFSDPAEHEQWLEVHPEPVFQLDEEPDYSFIDRLFERLEKMK